MKGPILRERFCGGWLALSPKDCEFRFGVTADTEREVRELYEKSLQRWRSYFDPANDLQKSPVT